jgi:hypothetical protein
MRTENLAAQTYLLAYDRDREKVRGRTWLGYTLRAAALADLWATGHLVDGGGRAVAGPEVAPPADPVLRDIWADATATPRRWEALINRDRRGIEKAILAQLETAGTIGIERPATWWRGARIEVRDPLALTRLAAGVAATLRGPHRLERLPAARSRSSRSWPSVT